MCRRPCPFVDVGPLIFLSSADCVRPIVPTSARSRALLAGRSPPHPVSRCQRSYVARSYVSAAHDPRDRESCSVKTVASHAIAIARTRRRRRLTLCVARRGSPSRREAIFRDERSAKTPLERDARRRAARASRKGLIAGVNRARGSCARCALSRAYGNARAIHTPAFSRRRSRRVAAT